MDVGGNLVARHHVAHQYVGIVGGLHVVGLVAVAETRLEVELVPLLADAHVKLAAGGLGARLVLEVHIHHLDHVGDHAAGGRSQDVDAVEAVGEEVVALGGGARGGEAAQQQQRDRLVEHVALVVAVDIGEDLVGDALLGIGQPDVEPDRGVLHRAGEGDDVLHLHVGVGAGGRGGGAREGGQVDALVVDGAEVEAGLVDRAGEY